MSSCQLDSDDRRDLARRLMQWFAVHARDLPWRHDRTPYRVWVSEVMLQQTQAATVARYYRRFLKRFPTIESLAGASLEEVLKMWEGLGYYGRARYLHQAARHLVATNSGRLPSDRDELQSLPGIGTYTAGAIGSIAFGQRVAAVDGNACRVLCRVFSIRDDVTRSATRRKLKEIATNLLPEQHAGKFNEALIELGATVCTSRSPSCQLCPLADLCRARAANEQETLPVTRRRGKRPHYDVAAAVTIGDDGAVLVARRKLDDMLGGLWEFPGGKCQDGESLPACLVREMEEELGVIVDVGPPLTVVEHAYTHFSITLHAFICLLVDGQPRCLDCAAFRWVRPPDLDELPMSVADRKIAQALVEESDHRATGK